MPGLNLGNDLANINIEDFISKSTGFKTCTDSGYPVATLPIQYNNFTK